VRLSGELFESLMPVLKTVKDKITTALLIEAGLQCQGYLHPPQFATFWSSLLYVTLRRTCRAWDAQSIYPR
jgi:hypothetical protein